MRHLAWSLLALAACGGSSGTGSTSSAGSGGPSGPHDCNPLQAPGGPLVLADLYGAGRDAAGTLYVADQGGRDHQRFFISQGAVLQRFEIAGSGLDGAGSLTLSIAEPPLTVRIDHAGPTPTQMGIVRGPVDGKTFDIGTQGEVLTLVGADALTGLTPKDVVDNVFVEYNATLPDGRHLFVTRPKVDWTYEDFRIFFGPPNAVLERPLVSASRGNTTYLTFTVDGTSYDAVLHAGPPLDDGHATITPAGGTAAELTLLPTTDTAALHFVCIK